MGSAECGMVLNAECGMRSAELKGRVRSWTQAVTLDPRAIHSALPIPRSAFDNVPHLRSRPVALLELLAAAARTRLVAADADVRVASERGLGHGRLRGAPGIRLAVPDEAVSGGLAGHHRLGTTCLLPARRRRHGGRGEGGGAALR